jgi:hypothetical protein
MQASRIPAVNETHSLPSSARLASITFLSIQVYTVLVVTPNSVATSATVLSFGPSFMQGDGMPKVFRSQQTDLAVNCRPL